MTSFENYLIDNGYLKFIADMKLDKYLEVDKSTYNISTLMDLDYHYIHPNKHIKLLELIRNGYSITQIANEFNSYRKGMIIFGLSEYKRPPTLISPRPRIEILRSCPITNEIIEHDEYRDDSMNVILSKFIPEEIIDAMYNRTVFKVDLTKEKE